MRNENASGSPILLIEDVSEETYRLDRSLVQLKRAGWLDHLAGVGSDHSPTASRKTPARRCRTSCRTISAGSAYQFLADCRSATATNRLRSLSAYQRSSTPTRQR